MTTLHVINIETILDKTKILNTKLEKMDSLSDEIQFRVKDINNSLQRIVNDLNELDIECYRDRKIVSNKVQEIIDENQRRDSIINHFLPSMTLYSVMQEDYKKNKMIGNNIINNETTVKDDFDKYIKTKFT
jgi:hypothetical protein